MLPSTSVVGHTQGGVIGGYSDLGGLFDVAIGENGQVGGANGQVGGASGRVGGVSMGNGIRNGSLPSPMDALHALRQNSRRAKTAPSLPILESRIRHKNTKVLNANSAESALTRVNQRGERLRWVQSLNALGHRQISKY